MMVLNSTLVMDHGIRPWSVHSRLWAKFFLMWTDQGRYKLTYLSVYLEGLVAGLGLGAIAEVTKRQLGLINEGKSQLLSIHILLPLVVSILQNIDNN